MASAPDGAAITDLRMDEKMKIGNLLRELARSQREAQQASQERQEYASRLQRMRTQHCPALNQGSAKVIGVWQLRKQLVWRIIQLQI